jgi:20S proteasome alpha/beta subunit
MTLAPNDLQTERLSEIARAVFGPVAASPKKKKPMTLIVGIICKDEIVVATDTRTTFPTHAEDRAKKLRIIDYAHGKALVAWSGYTAFSVDTVDVLEKEAASLEPKHYRDLAELAKRIVDDTRTREFAPFRGAVTSIDSVQNHLRDNMSFCLMLAYYFGGEPYLYLLEFPSGSIYREPSNFATLGLNNSLGSFLLNEYAQPNMSPELGTALAVYVIEAVAEHDKSVGGQTKVAVLQRVRPPTAADTLKQVGPTFIDLRPSAIELVESDVKKISKTASEVRAWIRSRHPKQLTERLARRSEKEINRMMANLYDGILSRPLRRKKLAGKPAIRPNE